MIGSLEGTITAKQPPWLLLEVNGVGYEVEAPMSTFYELPATGSSVRLHTHLVVRDDAHLLFGFATERERALFRALLKVNGVGARVALAILSGISVDGFTHCVSEGDAAALQRVPGIGRKTAERLVVEMRDRFARAEAGGGAPLAGGREPAPREEAHSALVALGYKPGEAAKMLDGVDDASSSEEWIRQALQSVARKR